MKQEGGRRRDRESYDHGSRRESEGPGSWLGDAGPRSSPPSKTQPPPPSRAGRSSLLGKPSGGALGASSSNTNGDTSWSDSLSGGLNVSTLKLTNKKPGASSGRGLSSSFTKEKDLGPKYEPSAYNKSSTNGRSRASVSKASKVESESASKASPSDGAGSAGPPSTRMASLRVDSDLLGLGDDLGLASPNGSSPVSGRHSASSQSSNGERAAPSDAPRRSGRQGSGRQAPGSAGGNRRDPAGRANRDYSLQSQYRRIGSMGHLSDGSMVSPKTATGTTSTDSMRTSTSGGPRGSTPRDSWPRFQRSEDEGSYNNMSLQDYMALLVTTPAERGADSGLGETAEGHDRWAVIPNGGLSDDDENPFGEMPPDYVSGSSEDEYDPPIVTSTRASFGGGRATYEEPPPSHRVRFGSRHDMKQDGEEDDTSDYTSYSVYQRGEEPRGGLHGSRQEGFDAAEDDNRDPNMTPQQQTLLASGNSYDLRPATAGDGLRNSQGPSVSEPAADTKEVDLAGLSGELFNPSVNSNFPSNRSSIDRSAIGRPSGGQLGAPGTPGGIRVSSAHARAEGAATGREMERPPSRQKPPPEALYLFSDLGQLRGSLYNSGPSSLTRPMTSAATTRSCSARAQMGSIPASVADASATLQRPPSRQRPPPESLGLDMESTAPNGGGFRDIFQDSDSDDDDNN